MKRCPECLRDYYDDSLLFCLDDGTALLEGPARSETPQSPSNSGRFSGEQRTAVLRETTADNEAPTRAQIHATEGGPPSSPGGWTVERGHSHWGSKLRIAGAAVIGMLILLGFGYGVYQFVRGRSGEKTSVPTAHIEIQRLTGDGRTRDAIISPDGKFLVYLRVGEGKESLWIKQIATGSNVTVLKPGEASRIAGITFSPDGNFIYLNARLGEIEEPTVYRVPTLGGAPVKFLSDAQFLRFSADGKFVSFRRADPKANKDSIIIANADGSNEREIATRAGKQFFSSAAAWSPDGGMLAVVIGDDSLGATDNMTIALISAADGSLREFGSRRWTGLGDPVWHPSGDSLIAITSENSLLPGQIWELSYPSGEYRKLTNNLNGHSSISITADGKSIVSGELYARSAVWVSPDLKPENAKPVMPSTGDTWGLSWTPEGRLVYISDQTGDAEVWIMDADGANARPLTSDRVFKVVPTVSPDGRFIVYTSSQNGGQLVRIDIDGRNPLALTKSLGADNPHISPDGRWVIFSAYVDGWPKVLRVPIGGGDEQVLTEDPSKEPRYSNDGTRFACFIFDERTIDWNRVAIFPADGGPALVTMEVPIETNSGRGPVWTPDDKGITLVVAPGEKQDLWLLPVDGGPAKQMTDFEVPGIARREYSHDGRRIAIVRAEGIGNAVIITGFR